MSPGVSVALPVLSDTGWLRAAFACIARQTLPELDVMLVLNGSDRATRDTAHDLARRDKRARVIELPEADLPGALNAALEAARFPLVARMDADDECEPDRLARQAAFMDAHPRVAALGSAWELAGPDGRVFSTVRPPCEPARLRWRLLLGNVLAHGSMMLRREAVRKAGGYDPRCARAQDYELWLRLARSHDLACLPEVLYRHRARFPLDPGRSTREQSAVAAPLMLEAWRALPGVGEQNADALERAIAAVAGRADGSGAIERIMDEDGPTREALTVWLWAAWQEPPASRRAIEAGRLARLREVGAALRKSAVTRVRLWGAGDHTRWLLEHAPQFGVTIDGVVDDARAGETRFGHRVAPPGDLRRGETAVISSDWHEDAIWESSAPHRERGVKIVRFYTDAP